MDDVTIRAYSPQDYADVRRNLEEGGLYYEAMDSEDKLTRLFERNPQAILVAEQHGMVVGNVIVLDEWGPLVFRLAVREEYRNRGIGTRLMDAAEDHLRKEGFRELHLMVGESETELKDYYRKRGYIEGESYRWMYKEL